MRQLFIMRHAAAESNVSKDDKLRSLSFQGRGELKRLVDLRIGLFDEVSQVICSTAIRTRQTLDGIQDILSPIAEISYFDSLYHAPAQTILEEIGLIDDRHHAVLVVGHNPGVSHLLAEVLKREAKPAVGSMPTAGIAYYRINSPTWRNLGYNDISFQSLFLPESKSDTSLS